MRVFLCTLAAVAAGAVVAAPALAGPDWIEMGDAGSSLGSAQRVVGINSLSRITGTLSTSTSTLNDRSSAGGMDDYEDMYLIRIQVPSTFTFQTSGASFNAQLYLFNITLPGEAFGLLASDDTPMSNSPLLTSPATDGSGAQVILPGVYAIGIAGFGRVPVSLTGPIFSFASTTEISGADGPGGLNPLTGWTGTGETGSYRINVEGIDFVDVPSPGAGVMVLGGIIGIGARRRRS